ncbi:MAG: hypothetical protein WDW38_000888 [Sanguina aurantia]
MVPPRQPSTCAHDSRQGPIALHRTWGPGWAATLVVLSAPALAPTLGALPTVTVTVTATATPVPDPSCKPPLPAALHACTCVRPSHSLPAGTHSHAHPLVADAPGDSTFIGNIATLASGTQGHTSTLQVEVHRLVVFVAGLALAMAVVLFTIGLARDQGASKGPGSGRVRTCTHHHTSCACASLPLVFALADRLSTTGQAKDQEPLTAFVNGFILIIVANIPEGLPTTVTSCLTLTAQRLRSRNVLIKRTDIIENLNKMTVEHVWVNTELHQANLLLPPPTFNVTAGPIRFSNPSAGAAPGTVQTPDADAGSRFRSAGSMPDPKVPLLGRVSRQSLLPSGTLRSSGDDAASMARGRAGLPRGDGTLEVVPVVGPSSSSKGSLSCDCSVMTQGPHGGPAPWAGTNQMTRLVIVATICNKAVFDDGSLASPTAHFASDAALKEGVERSLRSEGDPAAGRAGGYAMGELERRVLGDATDTGLLRYCHRLAPTYSVREDYPLLHSIPFNSANKWALTVCHCPGDLSSQLVMMKGAPEIIIDRCSSQLVDGRERPIDDSFLAGMTRAYERCGFMGERVIGFCYKAVPTQPSAAHAAAGDSLAEGGFVFAGLIALVDPPRDGVKEAVAKCRGHRTQGRHHHAADGAGGGGGPGPGRAAGGGLQHMAWASQ